MGCFFVYNVLTGLLQFFCYKVGVVVVLQGLEDEGLEVWV